MHGENGRGNARKGRSFKLTGQDGDRRDRVDRSWKRLNGQLAPSSVALGIGSPETRHTRSIMGRLELDRANRAAHVLARLRNRSGKQAVPSGLRPQTPRKFHSTCMVPAYSLQIGSSKMREKLPTVAPRHPNGRSTMHRTPLSGSSGKTDTSKMSFFGRSPASRQRVDRRFICSVAFAARLVAKIGSTFGRVETMTPSVAVTLLLNTNTFAANGAWGGSLLVPQSMPQGAINLQQLGSPGI